MHDTMTLLTLICLGRWVKLVAAVNLRLVDATTDALLSACIYPLSREGSRLYTQASINTVKLVFFGATRRDSKRPIQMHVIT